MSQHHRPTGFKDTFDSQPVSLSRRRFGHTALALPIVAAAACRSDPSLSVPRVLVATLAELDDGEPLAFDFPCVGTCFVVRLGVTATHGIGPDESIVAFSVLCPHMGCPIGLEAIDSSTGQFGPCVCHQSLFDLRREGRLVRGCATSNMIRILLVLESDEIYATGVVDLAFGQPVNESTALTTPEAAANSAGEQD